MKGVTKAQSQILAFIENFITEHHFSPSFSEIQHHFGFASVNAVVKHLNALKRKGLIHAEAKCSRSLALAPKAALAVREIHRLPLIGTMIGGGPLTLFASPEQVTLPSWLSPVENSYLIKVEGNNLQDELLAHGDLLMVATQAQPQAGNTIVLLVNKKETLVLQYYPEGTYVRLVSRNEHFQPIMLKVENIDIQGVVKGVIRNY